MSLCVTGYVYVPGPCVLSKKGYATRLKLDDYPETHQRFYDSGALIFFVNETYFMFQFIMSYSPVVVISWLNPRIALQISSQH